MGDGGRDGEKRLSAQEDCVSVCADDVLKKPTMARLFRIYVLFFFFFLFYFFVDLCVYSCLSSTEEMFVSS